MNDVSLLELENIRIQKLKDCELDSESILKFKSTIKQVDEEESEKLGKELYELVSKKKASAKLTDDFYTDVIKLIKDGANVEYKEPNKGNFLLLVCARKGFIDLAYILLRAGANVNQVNNFGTTATMAAARHGYKALLEIFILLGADVNAQYLDGDNALMSAKRHDMQECFDMLVKAQTYLNHRNLLNQSIREIPGNVNLNLVNVEDILVPKLDPFVLIEESEQKMNEIYSSVKTLTK